MTSTLYEQIQQFYDTSSDVWERVWGEHMHHGYYGSQGDRLKDRRQAQIDLMEELLDRAYLPSFDRTSQLLDIGCGIGGATLYLTQKFNIKGTGITLSPVQAARAGDRAREAGLEGQAGFLVANALDVPFADESFDLVWSLESGEHMPDKARFLGECYRLLKPGGTLVLATWCHRSTENAPLTTAERQHLEQIYQAYHLPYVISLPEYESIAGGLGFTNLQVEDWSLAVAPFWDAVIESAFDPMAMLGLLTSGWETIRGALAIALMRDGYRQGLIRYGVLWGTKSFSTPNETTTNE